MIGTTKYWFDEERDRACPPRSTPALSDDDVVPVWGLSYFLGATAAGVKAPSALKFVLEYFP
jgi:hypothetical protein